MTVSRGADIAFATASKILLDMMDGVVGKASQVIADGSPRALLSFLNEEYIDFWVATVAGVRACFIGESDYFCSIFTSTVPSENSK